MKRNLRILVMVLSLSLALFFVLLPVSVLAAGDYPSKPIQFIAPFAPGASTDLRVRAITPGMGQILGQPIVVINKPGASGTVALTVVAKAKPDGYTIGTLGTSGFLFAPHTQKVEFDPMNDFTFIACTATQPYAIVVRSDAPWKNINEFFDHVKNNPGTIKCGIAGMGGLVHIYMEMVAKEWGLKWDFVPFNGDQPNITALLGGHIPVAAISSAFVPHVKAGKFRLLALITEKRMELYPDIPTLKDLGLKHDLRANVTSCVCGPKGMLPDVVTKLERATIQAADGAENKRIMEQISNEVHIRNSKETEELFRELYPKIGYMIKEVGLKKQ
jgi:tripartite-type tricarboxylate transporter receptor subunit TctC